MPSNERYARYRVGCGKNAQVEAIWGAEAFRGLDGHA
jgi:peptide-methionine (S)-S-oxide reductase